MTAVWANAEWQDFIDIQVSAAAYGSGSPVKLFGNNYTPVAGSQDSDFSEAVFSGYVGQNLSYAASILDGDRYYRISSVLAFESNAGGTPDDVYGFWLDRAGGNSLFADRLTGAPVTIDGVDDDLLLRMVFDFYVDGEETLSDFIVNQDMLIAINDTWFNKNGTVSSSEINVRLFQNDYTPLASSVTADFTEANFSGYAGKLLNTSSHGASTIVSGRAERTSNVMTWTRSATGAAQTIYGYYLTNASEEFISGERFTSPITLTNSGEFVAFELVGSTGSIN